MQNCMFYFGNHEVSWQQLLLEVRHQAVDKQLFDMCCKYWLRFPFPQANAGMVPSHGFSPRSYFFDNPRRYDSDDDLAWNIAPQGAQGRWDTRVNLLLPKQKLEEEELWHTTKDGCKLSSCNCCINPSRLRGSWSGKAALNDCGDPRAPQRLQQHKIENGYII